MARVVVVVKVREYKTTTNYKDREPTEKELEWFKNHIADSIGIGDSTQATEEFGEAERDEVFGEDSIIAEKMEAGELEAVFFELHIHVFTK